jgi:hypothetical protein
MEGIKRFIFLVLCVFQGRAVLAQTTFYNPGAIQKVELSFSQSNWDHQLDTAKYGSDSYIMAQWVKINGVRYDSVGVKYKGNSSYDSTYIKNPLHIALDEFKNQSYQGYTDVKLGNNYADPSMIREVLSYTILQNYMDCPHSNFAQLYINGAYVGLYSNEENINKKLLADRFYSSAGIEVKGNPIVNPGPTTKCNLKYIAGADSSGYFNYYEIKSKYGWNELVALCDTVTNYPASMANNLDMDRVLWMLAYDNVLVNLDSYMGVFCQNYYLYKDGTNRFNPIIWDLNMSFGGFPYIGSGNTSMGTLTIANMQQLSPTTHSTDPYWPLIKNILADPMYKRMYIAHMRTITGEFFANNNYQTIAAQMQTVVDTAVQSDLNKFYTYSDFQNGMTTNVSVGSYSVAGISNLMGPRVTYLQATPEFGYSAPAISVVSASPALPAYNSSVSITAQVTNTSLVYLGYRFSKADKFVRVLMYDDGAHNDGAAGDSVYGTSVVMQSGQMQYYIYAENTNAGMFSPQRAEHEFYTLMAQSYQPAIGDLVINEILADNTGKEKDEYGEREDWIELYNNSANLLDLSNLYLSNDAAQIQKWKIPDSTTLVPNGYLMVWADKDSLQKTFHTNFNLNKTGDIVILSNSGGTVLDSISFATQFPNISFGRYPNGTGPFGQMPTTFSAQNSASIGIAGVAQPETFLVYPNPTNELIHILNGSEIASIEIRNSLGQLMLEETFRGERTFNTSAWPGGLYFIRSGALNQKIIVQH